ncbi:hypothetical protein Bca4012_081302 [Brassica carinata]
MKSLQYKYPTLLEELRTWLNDTSSEHKMPEFLCVHGSTIRKRFNLLDVQDESKFMVWMKNNKFHQEVEDYGNPYCCSKSYFVWDPKLKTWILD